MKHEREIGLAATKLRPPVLPDRLVSRPRLDQIVDTAIDNNARLVLASAAAGSGKTTFLAARLTERPDAVSWLQVEASDSDPGRFWLYLIESIGQVHPRIVAEVKPIVVGNNADELVVVPELVNRLGQLDETLVVVIDDYHLIESAAVHRGVERLIELCPEQVSIVLSTRFDPPFRLSRLRVRNQMVEIRGADLRFEPDEAGSLLGRVAQTLDSSQVAEICGRTEGWAAGLVLAGLSLERAEDPAEFLDDFHGDDQLVVDYLSDEFLGGINDDDRRVFLETSILDQMNGALVDQVTGSTGGAPWLRRTAKANQLLLGLDSTGTWFRYHHLLRDLLRVEAHQEFPQLIPELHARAAEWFESQKDFGQAIEHRLAADQRDEAARLMLVYGPGLLSNGQIETLWGLLERLGDVARKYGWCTLLYGWCEYIAGHYSLAEEWLDTTLDVVSDGFDEDVTAGLRMNIALGRGNVAEALEIARRLTASGQLVSHTSDIATVAGGVYTLAGLTDEARVTLTISIEKAVDEEARASQILALIYLAIATFEDGTKADAQEAATLVLDTAQDVGLGSYYRLAPAFAIRARAESDPDRAHADALHAVDLAQRTPGDLILAHVLTMCADTLIDLGDAAGEPLLVEARSVVDRCSDPGIVGRYLVRTESRHHVAVDDVRADVLVEQLTEREMAVLRYLPTPMSQRDIAAELYVSLNTVKTHCGAIYRKLAVSDRKSAVQAARDLNLL
jgi:LuxR family maltose regulon positive regulatory protein